MKTYLVIHHDRTSDKAINFEKGYHVTSDLDNGFRAVPITAVIWSYRVTVKKKGDAANAARACHKAAQHGYII